MPPNFIKQEGQQTRATVSPPQHIQQQQPPPPTDVQEESKPESVAPQPQMLEPVKRMSVKSRSIFTPIDEGHSILSQHWATSTSHGEPLRIETATSNVRALTIDPNLNRTSSPPRAPAPSHNKRNVSISSTSDGTFAPPSRTNSVQLGPKRPVLQLQIPEEPSSAGSATAESNSPGSGTNATGSQRPRNSESHSSGVVLPPPSPSAASALLSAGASGPPNPFARPHPVSQPSQSSNNGNSNLIDTPVSALPSRFMNNEFLPSPSSFYPEWNFRGNDSNTLPSPLNFATPVVGTGPSFLREDSGERGGSSGNASQGGTGNGVKRKTPEAGESGDAKRPKIET